MKLDDILNALWHEGHLGTNKKADVAQARQEIIAWFIEEVLPEAEYTLGVGITRENWSFNSCLSQIKAKLKGEGDEHRKW